MSGFDVLHLSPAMAGELAALGYDPADPGVKDVVPVVARGHNLVAQLPPAAVHAVPVLAGLLSAHHEGESLGPGLILAPAASLAEWSAVAGRLARRAGLSFHAARGPLRASRRLGSGCDLLLTDPETALALQRRSALKIEAIRYLVLAWPELLESTESLTTVMGDLPRESQRIIVTSRPEAASGLIERYAWRAQLAGGGSHPPVLPGRVRVVCVAWQERANALPLLFEMLDPAAPVLWAAHRGSAQTLDSALEVSGLEARVITGDAPSTPLIIGWDLPAPAQLAQLAAAAEVVLLVPPYAERFVRSMVPALQSLRLPGLMEVAAGEAAARRAEILRTLETGGVEPAVLTLAPLFERHDPTAVAAALYQLWTARTPVLLPTTPAAGSPAQAPVTARMWVGAGQKDGVTANDLVATLTREVGVDKGKIGKIEIRELYSLVELPAAEVERIAGATNGLTIRRRRVTARVDRGGRDARKEVRGKK